HSAGFCIVCALDSLFMSLVNYISQALYIYEFVHHITIFSSSFMLFKQEYAYEFLLGVFNLLEMKFDDSKIPYGRKPCLPINLLRDFFLCSTISIISCSNCLYTSSQTETCYGLSLSITAEMSLIAEMSFFTKTEELSDVSCDGCNHRVKAEKKILLKKRAPFLILQLNTFSSFEDKIKGCIAFPLLLDMSPYCSSLVDMCWPLPPRLNVYHMLFG
ncbi:UCH domain-containing protein, partial [Cephalotus follicularis]